jgi:hypothetical protein
VSTSGAGLRHRNFTARPGTRLLNRSAWAVIIGLYMLEKMQNMLGAIRCPYGEKAMIGIL